MPVTLFTVISPAVDIAVVALAMTLFSTMIQKKLGVRKEQKEMQAEMKEKQKKLIEMQKSGKADSEQAKRLQQEIMTSTMNMMKKSLKPMAITMLVILPMLWTLQWNYEGAVIMEFSYKIPLIGTQLGWFGWYIIVSIVFSIILTKIILR